MRKEKSDKVSRAYGYGQNEIPYRGPAPKHTPKSEGRDGGDLNRRAWAVYAAKKLEEASANVREATRAIEALNDQLNAATPGESRRAHDERED